jgi:hypothetical protein
MRVGMPLMTIRIMSAQRKLRERGVLICRYGGTPTYFDAASEMGGIEFNNLADCDVSP